MGLRGQVDKIIRHNNQGSFKTRHRYEEAAYRFCKFLADDFRLQKFRNIHEKHVRAYVEHLKETGKSASTIKTDLSAIRFVYDQSGGNNRLPENSDLVLERRQFGGVYRVWWVEVYEAVLWLVDDMEKIRVR